LEEKVLQSMHCSKKKMRWSSINIREKLK